MAKPTLGGPKKSKDLRPHFETVGGRKVFYYEGWPDLILTVEIPWLGLEHGRYRQTLGVYDYLYRPAREIGLTALKVPIKWDMTETAPGRYDYSYLEHVMEMAERNDLKLVIGWFGHYASGDGTIYRNLVDEVFAPMYIVQDAEKYPRAVDADGKAHHNCASYAYDGIVKAETAAFRAFMRHLKRIDSRKRMVQMIQVENEIALFGWDRRNRKLWRDHSPAAEKLRKQWGYKKGGKNDLVFTARLMGEKWLDPISRAGRAEYPIPQFFNYVSGILAPGTTGGSPGEDIATHKKTCPTIDFIGRNLYMQPQRTVKEMRGALKEWCVGGNIPAITETNSGPDPVSPRLAYLSIGEFGAPIFAPWALDTSYPGGGQPYVLPDGSLANGAFALRKTYLSLRSAPAQIAHFAATDRLKVFLSEKPGESFRSVQSVGGIEVGAGGRPGGQGIAVRLGKREMLMLGFDVGFSLKTGRESWPALKTIKAENGHFQDGLKWVRKGPAKHVIDQAEKRVKFSISSPGAVRITW